MMFVNNNLLCVVDEFLLGKEVYMSVLMAGHLASVDLTQRRSWAELPGYGQDGTCQLKPCYEFLEVLDSDAFHNFRQIVERAVPNCKLKTLLLDLRPQALPETPNMSEEKEVNLLLSDFEDEMKVPVAPEIFNRMSYNQNDTSANRSLEIRELDFQSGSKIANGISVKNKSATKSPALSSARELDEGSGLLPRDSFKFPAVMKESGVSDLLQGVTIQDSERKERIEEVASQSQKSSKKGDGVKKKARKTEQMDEEKENVGQNVPNKSASKLEGKESKRESHHSKNSDSVMLNNREKLAVETKRESGNNSEHSEEVRKKRKKKGVEDRKKEKMDPIKEELHEVFQSEVKPQKIQANEKVVSNFEIELKLDEKLKSEKKDPMNIPMGPIIKKKEENEKIKKKPTVSFG